MNEEEYDKKLEEMFTHPHNWDDMTEKEQHVWSYEQTIKVSSISKEMIDSQVRKGIENKLRKYSKRLGHYAGILFIVMLLSVIAFSKGFIDGYLTLAILMISFPLFLKMILKSHETIKEIDSIIETHLNDINNKRK